MAGLINGAPLTVGDEIEIILHDNAECGFVKLRIVGFDRFEVIKPTEIPGEVRSMGTAGFEPTSTMPRFTEPWATTIRRSPRWTR